MNTRIAYACTVTDLQGEITQEERVDGLRTAMEGVMRS